MGNNAQFERNFIARTYPLIVSDMSVAIAELVANAWDAGATKVEVSIPEKDGENIIIEDNGSGMTDAEFRDRWMIIAFNRVEHMGEYTSFHFDGEAMRRRVYGRNGVGRHGLFCFNNKYTVETWKEGILNVYEITACEGESVFKIAASEKLKRDGAGTRLIVAAKKCLPNANDIRKTLGRRFMFDPQFNISVNGQQVEQTCMKLQERETLRTEYGDIKVDIFTIPEGEKSIAESGIAMWVNNRLVGSPMWVLAGDKIEDARRKFAIRHLVVVKADFLADDVLNDWSDFKKSVKVSEVYKVVAKHIRSYRIKYYKGRTSEVRGKSIRQYKDSIRNLSIPAVYHLSRFFDAYLEQKPEVEANDLNVIVAALINVLSNDSGVSLLEKLSAMSGDDIVDLDKILDEWSVSDIKTTLDEIGGRLKVINAIQDVCSNKNTDELHVLHPLVASARWLFGPEFDTTQYTFNKTLSTVLQKLLERKLKLQTAINWDKRPDLVVCEDSTFASTCVEDFDKNGILRIEKILIIELKKGGFRITRKEVNQAIEYAESIYAGDELNARPKIKAYVVGDKVDSELSSQYTMGNGDIEVSAYTYNQLISTAERRLFNLKRKLEDYFKNFDTDNYIKEILEEPDQKEFPFPC